MRYRIAAVKPLGAAIVALAASVALLAVSGCTVYQDPGYYSDDYDDYYDDEPVYDEVVDDPYVVDFSDLDYWGQWMQLAPYGTVWRPTVVLGWEPMAEGQWMWTNLGWTWISYEPFGWATYHYGWWAWDYAWGWIWIPDYEWHPARVQWLYYDDVIAWAPLFPPDFPIYDPWTPIDCDPWRVVRSEDFTDDHVARRIIRFKDRKRPRDRSTVIYHEPDPTQVHTGLRSTKPIQVELVPDPTDARIERIKLPRDKARPIAEYRKRSESEFRDAQKRAPRRPVERPRPPRVRDDSTPPARGSGDDDGIDRRPPPREEQKKEPPPAQKDRPQKEKPKREPEKKPEKQPETKPDKRPEKEPEKKPPRQERPQKEEPRKEKPKKEEPRKEEPARKNKEK